MKNLIIACGNYGSTLKAADILSRRLDGDTTVIDANEQKINLEGFDNVILGGNVHMNKLNKNFRIYAKKLKKLKKKPSIFVYILCGFFEKANGYLQRARKAVPDAVRVDFVGGVLSAQNVTGFWANVIIDAREGLKKAGKPLPALDRKQLEEIAQFINCAKI